VLSRLDWQPHLPGVVALVVVHRDAIPVGEAAGDPDAFVAAIAVAKSNEVAHPRWRILVIGGVPKTPTPGASAVRARPVVEETISVASVQGQRSGHGFRRLIERVEVAPGASRVDSTSQEQQHDEEQGTDEESTHGHGPLGARSSGELGHPRSAQPPCPAHGCGFDLRCDFISDYFIAGHNHNLTWVLGRTWPNVPCRSHNTVCERHVNSRPSDP
jgi:hypothetical protein